jgi:hypothetical protein
VKIDRHGNEFIATVRVPSTTDTIRVLNGGILLLEKVYESRRLCDAAVRFGSGRSARMSIAEIRLNPVLRVYFPCPFHGVATVTQFTLKLAPSNRKGREFPGIDGNRLLTMHLDAIGKLRPGDRIILEDIRAVGSFCPRILRPVVVTVR